MKHRVKVKKSLVTPQTIANGMAQDWIAAVYASVGNRTVDHLRSGEDLEDVVDQSLTHDGMIDTLQRLSSTRIQISVGIDTSYSMFGSRQPAIKPAMYAARCIHRALRIVEAQLPPHVFKWTFWLWASDAVCINYPQYGRFAISCGQDEESVDDYFSDLALGRKHDGISGGTNLNSFVSGVSSWEMEHGDPTAHKLDLVITDGAISNRCFQQCQEIMATRTGRLTGLLLTISNDSNQGVVGYTAYNVSVHTIRQTINDQMLEFVSRLF